MNPLFPFTPRTPEPRDCEYGDVSAYTFAVWNDTMDEIRDTLRAEYTDPEDRAEMMVTLAECVSTEQEALIIGAILALKAATPTRCGCE